MAGGACVVIACVSLFIGLAAYLGATVTSRWYVVELINSETEIGLFKSCVSGTCNSHNYDSIVASLHPTCIRKASDVQARMVACQAMMIIATISCFIALLVAVGAKFTQGALMWLISMGLLVLSCMASATAIIIWVFTLNNWLYCNKTYCEFFGTTVCESSFGYSVVLAGIGFLLAFVGIISTGCGYSQTKSANLDEEDEFQAAQTQSPGGAKKTHRSRSPQRSPQTHALGDSYMPTDDGTGSPTKKGDAGEKDLPEGDWAFDAESGLYWSENEQLYLDRDSEHYYDPSSGYWYDPAADKWYQQEDE